MKWWIIAWFGIVVPLSAQYGIPQQVVASGGGPMTSGTYQLWATIGEPIVGRATSSVHSVIGGFVLSYRQIQVLQPTSGSVWYTGTTQTIRWRWIGEINRVSLYQSLDGGNNWSPITTNILNTGSYSWIPTSASTQAVIRVQDAVVSNIAGRSGLFTLQNPGPASITIIAPQSGTVWEAGSAATIRWSWSGNIPQVDLFFSANDGRQWSTIATAVANNGSYQWQVPEAPTVVGRIWVRQSGSPTVGATSANFEIRSTTQTAVNIAVWLEGPLDATAGSMQTVLESSGYLPTSQPYGTWGYSGSEQKASWLTGIVDWVLVEVRATTNIATAVVTTAGLLRSDGKIIDESGYPQLLVPTQQLPAGTYYLVCRHWNHLDVMSSTAATLNVGASPLYDFRLTTATTYSQFAPGSKWISNKAVMVGGDVYPDGIINARDRVHSRMALFQTGYRTSDVNRDGTVNATDRTMVRSNTFWVTQVP